MLRIILLITTPLNAFWVGTAVEGGRLDWLFYLNLIVAIGGSIVLMLTTEDVDYV